MRRWLGYLLVGLLAYAAFLLAQAPASLAIQRLEDRLPARLTGISGTVWSGHASRVSTGEVLLGELGWQLQPMALASGRLSAAVQLEGPLLGRARISMQPDASLAVTGASLRIAADLVNELLRLPAAIGGELLVDIERLELPPGPPFEGTLPEVRGQITWPEARVPALLDAPLGEFVLDLRRAGDHIEGRLKSADGQLDASGRIDVDARGNFDLSLQVEARTGAPQQVRVLLRSLTGQGRGGPVSLRDSGNLHQWL